MAHYIYTFKAYDTSESFLWKSLVQENLSKYLRKFYTTHMQVEQQKLQVKTGVASWVLLFCECGFNLTTTIIIFVVTLKLKFQFQSIRPWNSGQ